MQDADQVAADHVSIEICCNSRAIICPGGIGDAILSGYDFRNLNDKEFEILANDLLSKREGAIIDRFKAGKDGGVDGRFFAIDGKEVIIQSKHWIKSGITALIKQLAKNELPKINQLNPSRYILVTSLGNYLVDVPRGCCMLWKTLRTLVKSRLRPL